MKGSKAEKPDRKGGVKKTQVAIRLPDDLLDQIQRRAKIERRNRSNMIEWLLRKAIGEIKE